MAKKATKPLALHRGDTIGIVAPASSFNRDNFKIGLKMLRKLGYKVKYERAIFNQCWSQPGHNKHRAAQINRMFTDKDVKAILCAKAGYGSVDIIPYLDHDIIRHNPKIFVGYSDITILLLYLQKMANMVVFHGPVVSGEIYDQMLPVTLDYLLRAFSQTTPLGAIMFPELTAFKPGHATGILVGGNISRIVEALNTPYQIKPANKILFLEDVDESPEVLRQHFLQLQKAGLLRDIKGLLLGKMLGCFDDLNQLQSMMTDLFNKQYIPLLYGFPSGHTKNRHEPHVTLPLGIEVTIDADHAMVIINEAAVRK